MIGDVKMLVLDGLEMVKRLREIAALEKLPILMVTTEVGADMAKRARAAGATGWISKPFKVKFLFKGVNRVLSSR